MSYSLLRGLPKALKEEVADFTPDKLGIAVIGSDSDGWFVSSSTKYRHEGRMGTFPCDRPVFKDGMCAQHAAGQARQAKKDRERQTEHLQHEAQLKESVIRREKAAAILEIHVGPHWDFSTRKASLDRVVVYLTDLEDLAESLREEDA